MNDAGYRILADYIRALADRMGLRDWTFMLEREPSAEGTYASVSVATGRRIAKIRVQTEFRGATADAQRNAIVHELIHVPFERAAEVLREDAMKVLDQGAYDVLDNTFRRQMEYGTDALATAIDRFYPHIDWGECEASPSIFLIPPGDTVEVADAAA